MYTPEAPKPPAPTPEPASAWERMAAKIAALETRIKQLESDRDELFLAMERARIPRWPGGTPDA